MSEIDVSIVLPVYNCELWIDDCLNSVLNQNSQLKIELSVFLDSCTDETKSILNKWISRFKEAGFKTTISEESNSHPKGVGYSKNMATLQSSGQYLCFMDADDMMAPSRIQKQYEVALLNQDAIVGSKFTRIPEDSTLRFTKWANSLTEKQLYLQIYTSHGPTVIMPTWFCHRNVYKRVGGFDESGKGTPEDLLFFYEHLKRVGKVCQCKEELLIYRYHPNAATFSVHEETIWEIRIAALQERVLSSWCKFSIWNAGKQGRKFYRSLKDEHRKKVSCFCDVDVNKIGKFYNYEESREKTKPKIPIVHFKDCQPPLIICVKMDLTDGIFESNLASLNLEEGKDYFHFN